MVATLTTRLGRSHRNGETQPLDAFAVQCHQALGRVKHRLNIGRALGDGHFGEPQDGVGGLEFAGVGVAHAQSL